MIKKVLGLLVLIAVMASCASKEQKTEEVKENEVAVVTVDEVAGDMLSHVDKEIAIKGTVNHVCSHGGKRMFIMGEDPDVAIQITPNDEIGVFEKELEGSHVIVTGIVTELRIDEAYVASLEKEVAEETDSEAMHEHSHGEHGEDEADVEAERKAKFEAMREKIAASENGYYSKFWVEASKFEVKECDHGHEHGHEHAEGEEHDHDHEHEHAEGEEHDH